MRNQKIFIIMTVAIVLANMIGESEAGCWEYLSGSICDNDGIWGWFGFGKCAESCKSKGFKNGRCRMSYEHCLGLILITNVCKCYKYI